MQAHKAHMIATKRTEEGGVAYCYGCCDDPGTYSWLHFPNPHLLTDADMEKDKNYHACNVEARHHHMASHKETLRQCEVMPIMVGNTSHNVTVADHSVHHDEGVKIELSCCGEHSTVEILEGLHLHTSKEVKSRIADLAQRLALSHEKHTTSNRLIATAQAQIDALLKGN